MQREIKQELCAAVAEEIKAQFAVGLLQMVLKKPQGDLNEEQLERYAEKHGRGLERDILKRSIKIVQMVLATQEAGELTKVSV